MNYSLKNIKLLITTAYFCKLYVHVLLITVHYQFNWKTSFFLENSIDFKMYTLKLLFILFINSISMTCRQPGLSLTTTNVIKCLIRTWSKHNILIYKILRPLGIARAVNAK